MCFWVPKNVQEKKPSCTYALVARKWAFLLSVITFIMLVWQLVLGCNSVTSSLLFLLGSAEPASLFTTGSRWVRDSEDTSVLLQRIRMNGTTHCHHMRTHGTEVVGLPGSRSDGLLYMHTDTPFIFNLISIGENGTARCAGGDFYETELEGEHWKSRPPVKDHGNGTYSVTLLVDGAFEGVYNFTAHLLYDNFHGLDEQPSPWILKRKVVWIQIRFAGRSQGKVGRGKLPMCKADDLRGGGGWRGRWTRGWYNGTCEADREGRFRCLGEDHERCEGGWCEGKVGRLESNGWVYSEKCAFRIWEEEEAWECLSGKWLFFWGDSNLPDMLRNMLLFVLGYPPPTWANVTNWYIERAVEDFFINPQKPHQSFHVSLIYNGHHNKKKSGMGLDSLRNESYRQWLHHHFNGSSFPDLFIMNTGLHDGIRFPKVDDFISALDHAVDFWHSVFQHVPADKLPTILLRTAVAPAGNARAMQSNPQKMDVFNAFMVERFKRLQVDDLFVIDAFDPSFPFHFDYSCSDGGHYGRPPKYVYWPWFGQPHHYFVEVMLVHMMLNAICNK